jgi:hypothetical protein
MFVRVNLPRWIALLAFSALPLSADEQLKKLVLLDFKNLTGDPNYNYLEESMTDATRTYLRERFAFSEAERGAWQSTLKQNNFFAKDLHTESVGLNVGLIMKQDVVINGGFVVTQEASRPTITTTVHIFDVRNRRVLTTFQVSGPADSKIFDSIQRIARNIADEAKPLLPNKEEYASGKYVEEFQAALYRYNLLLVRGGIAPAGFPDNGNTLAAETKLSTADIRGSIPVHVEYQRLEVLGSLFLFGRAGYQFGSRTYRTEPFKTTATGELASFQFAAGPGFVLPLKFIGNGRLSAKIQTGFLYAETTITLQASGAEPRKLAASSPGGIVAAGLAIALTQRLSAEVSAEYAHFAYRDAQTGMVACYLALGLRI